MLSPAVFDALLSSITKQYTKEVPQSLAELLSRIDAFLYIKKRSKAQCIALLHCLAVLLHGYAKRLDLRKLSLAGITLRFSGT